jgi:hypothetical protein
VPCAIGLRRRRYSLTAVNALCETDRVTLLHGSPATVLTPSASGKGQKIVRCPSCRVAVWSHYSSGDFISFVRVGSLDDPSACPPEAHIYVTTRQPWVQLPPDAKTFPGFYDPRTTWPADSMARWKAARDRAKA